MKTYGPLYRGSLKYYHTKLFPIIELGWTQETDHPYRKGRCLVFRVPFTIPGYFIGLWVKRPKIHPDNDVAIDALLSDAMGARKAWVPQDGRYEDAF